MVSRFYQSFYNYLFHLPMAEFSGEPVSNSSVLWHKDTLLCKIQIAPILLGYRTWLKTDLFKSAFDVQIWTSCYLFLIILLALVRIYILGISLICLTFGCLLWFIASWTFKSIGLTAVHWKLIDRIGKKLKKSRNQTTPSPEIIKTFWDPPCIILQPLK